MLRKLSNVPFVQRLKQEDVHGLLRPGRISGLYILASRFDTLFRERQILLDQLAVGVWTPRKPNVGGIEVQRLPACR